MTKTSMRVSRIPLNRRQLMASGLALGTIV